MDSVLGGENGHVLVEIGYRVSDFRVCLPEGGFARRGYSASWPARLRG